MQIQHSRKGVSGPLAAVAIVTVLVLAFIGITYYPPPGGNTFGGGTKTSASQSQGGTPCGSAPISSELTTYNAQAISSGTVAVYAPQASGAWAKLSDASSSQTLNTFNTASSYYSTPWVTLWNASAAYEQLFQVSGVPSTDANGDKVTCVVPQGSSNAVLVFQQVGQVYLGPASGTSATTNVESVVGSTSSQTNSFPAAFPTSALTVTAYLQGFANNIVGMRPVTMPASINQPITDYGGINGVPTQSVQKTSGLVYFQGYAIVAFNQTGISFSGPAGTVPIPITGQTGEKAWLVPVTSNGACASSGTGTGAPCILSSFSFTVQETIAATGKHIEMIVQWVDNTQAGYILQYFSTPGVTSFGSSGQSAGILTGFGGLSAPTGGSTGGIRPIIEQGSKIIATY